LLSIEEISKSDNDKRLFSIDLMMGIPHQTLLSYENSLRKLLTLGFGHSSFYILTLEQKTPFFKKY
jgi:oxygen-independent coproporphyrinogen-3 oxidase